MKTKIRTGRPHSRKRLALSLAADSNLSASARYQALLAAQREGASKKVLVACCW